MSATSALSISNGGTFTYDRVMVNAGGGYDATQNVFRCPVTGFYLFTFNTLAPSRSSGADHGIMIDDTPLIGWCAHGSFMTNTPGQHFVFFSSISNGYSIS